MSDDKCWDQQLILLKCTDTLCDIYNYIKIQERKHIFSALIYTNALFEQKQCNLSNCLWLFSQKSRLTRTKQSVCSLDSRATDSMCDIHDHIIYPDRSTL